METELIQLTSQELKAFTRSGREAWDEAFGNQIESKKAWQRVAFGCLIVAALAVCACIYFAGLPKQIAYVVERDQLGHIKYGGKLNDQTITPDVWDAIYSFKLETFIRQWRAVSSDKTFRDANWDAAFDSVGKGSQANQFLNEWYSAHDPGTRAVNGETVTVSIDVTERQSQSTYAIWWTETTIADRSTTVKKYRSQMTFVPVKDKPIEFLITDLTLEEVHAKSNH